MAYAQLSSEDIIAVVKASNDWKEEFATNPQALIDAEFSSAEDWMQIQEPDYEGGSNTSWGNVLLNHNGNWVKTTQTFGEVQTSANIKAVGERQDSGQGDKENVTVQCRLLDESGAFTPFGLATLLYSKKFVAIGTAKLSSGAIVARVKNVSSLVQTHFGLTSKAVDKVTGAKLAGKPLDKPIIRSSIPFKRTDGLPTIQVLDFGTATETADGALEFGEFTVDHENANGDKVSEPLSRTNVHKAIYARSTIAGGRGLSRYCISGQGLSIPVKFTLLVVKRSEGYKPDVNAMFNKGDLLKQMGGLSLKKSTSPPTPTPTSTPAPAPVEEVPPANPNEVIQTDVKDIQGILASMN